MITLRIGTILLVSIILIAIFTAGCTTDIPPPGTIVKCTDYYRITDKYKTPGPEYHIKYEVNIENSLKYESDSVITEEQYNIIKVGQYMKFWGSNVPINLEKLSESDSGFRNACKVLP